MGGGGHVCLNASGVKSTDLPPSAAREGGAGSRGVCSSVRRQLELAAN